MNNPKLRFKADDGSKFPEWEERRIDSFANCYAGATPSTKVAEYWQNGSIPWMSSGEVNNREIYETEKKISELGYEKSSTKMIKPNTVVIALAGQGKTRGMVAIARISVCTNQSLCAIETNDMVNDDYLYQYLITQYDNLRRISSGDGTRGGLNLQLVGEYKVFLPVLPEQCKIADLLSAVDDVIAAQEAEVAAWERRKKGVMQKLFSQEVRFKADDGSDFPDWEEKTLGDICMYERQHSEGANFVGTENMLKDFGGVTFDNSNADGSGTLYHPGDTLTSNIRPYLKKAWLADRKGTCSTDVLVFHPTSVEPGYLYWLIASDAFVRYVMSAAKGSKMPRGDKKHIMEMPLLLPNKDEQRKIDDCLSSLNGVIIKAKNELAKWQELKKGLLQQMFV